MNNCSLASIATQCKIAFFCVLSCLPTSILCMKTLLRLLQHHAMYKDVFREVGLLEVMVTCLHRYAALLKEPQTGKGNPGDGI